MSIADETRCHKCGRETRVTHTYNKPEMIVRRRKCKHCRRTFKTSQPYEKPLLAPA